MSMNMVYLKYLRIIYINTYVMLHAYRYGYKCMSLTKCFTVLVSSFSWDFWAEKRTEQNNAALRELGGNFTLMF